MACPSITWKTCEAELLPWASARSPVKRGARSFSVEMSGIPLFDLQKWGESYAKNMLWTCRVPLLTQWFCWSDNPVFKWLFHWGYTLFSDIPISRDDGWLMAGWWLVDGYAFANGSAGRWMLVVSGAFWSRDNELRHFGAKEPSNPQNR